MLLDELGRELVEVTSALVGGRTINIMNTDGVIVASSEHHRVGSYHQGAIEAVRTGKVVNIRKDQLERYPGAREGCNMPLRVNGSIIGVVGIYGDPEEIREVAHLLEVYATKYYQLETMLQPRQAEITLRSRLLGCLLSPSGAAMSTAQSLAENLNIRFSFPVHTMVVSSAQRLSLPTNAERLYGLLESLGFLKKQCDVWGIVEERLVLLCSTLEGRQTDALRQLSAEGYRVSLGDPSQTLWQIQDAYEQALVLELSGEEHFNDICRLEARCHYMLSRTAQQETAFLEGLAQKLRDTFSAGECPVLLESVKAYYDCGRSVTAAAQQLFIHKNTLQYRVRRVLEVLELQKLHPFRQEYLVRLIIGHLQRKSRSEDLEN